ncbi:23S rRNA (adenine-N6)-dimethyltransferase [Saccharopolyspora antimicrobica]|uniref:23S rRNA (Adenine-N6)-dimethyltransferase n=1 Tax=Saccharopolyspora antimicrobica TaxID=455193 RepID=A0A1I4XJJ1_9PSEU|nr:23S ribosomal RNA methyltransferase Erm [Saccharopolyspora antimicrobica]RKT84517.1 23S rRNA (adenine-N6)-dimethyltransferase [Saccharopolyspora antimicrobica]SFN25410.1 23S rRNA (adenine-N6)-dimethyltransferase [Saccharopolyspora antimicrobica]
MSSRRRSARDRARRELGQNFLVDRGVVRRLVDLLEPAPLPVVELGAGSGAITRELLHSGRQVTAVELDPRWAQHLRDAFPDLSVIRCDMLDFRFPTAEHAVIGNLPFGITTSVTRRLLTEKNWSEAVLLVQWDVARKRAEGGTQLNAQWAPWYEFHSCGRVPARSFRPRPAVDGGILKVRRRTRPLVPLGEQRRYQRFVEAVFTGRGRGLTEIVRNITGHRLRNLPALPRDLPPEAWPRLYTETT